MITSSWSRWAAGLLAAAAANCQFDRPADVGGPIDAATECEASTAACVSETSRVCNDAGQQLPDEQCWLGCRESTGRCERIDASNGLNAYLDQGRSRSVIDLRPRAFVNTSTGLVTVDGTPVSVESILVDAPAEGVAVRVLLGRSFEIGDVTVTGTAALAIVAPGSIVVSGIIHVAANGRVDGPGGAALGRGTETMGAGDLRGPGGGGFASRGGNGGTVPGNPSELAGGAPSGGATLEPLRGGASGGARWTDLVTALPGGGGGGAIQLSSEISISLNIGGGIDASGGAAEKTGGGAGGGILIEAPTIVVDGAFVVAAGAGGGSYCGQGLGEDGRRDGTVAMGAPSCNSGGSGAGGAGGVSFQIPAASGAPGNSYGGAGGGGYGRVVLGSLPSGVVFSGSPVLVPDPDRFAIRVRP